MTGEIGSVVGSVRGTIYTKQYDGAGRLTGVNAGALKTAIAYDGFGRKAKISHSDGTTGTMDYDALNRMVSVRWQERGRDSVFQALTYDLAGNITKMARENGTYSLSYDSTDQLIRSDFSGMQGVPEYDRSFEYDLVGNLHNDPLSEFVSNFLTKNGQSSFTADPDGFGDMLQEITADKVKNYTYRADGKVSSFQSGNLSGNYFYDGLDRLIAKAINDGASYTQSFVHLGDENGVLLGKAGNGTVATFIDGKGPLERLGEVTGSVGKGYITDHLGSVLNAAPAGSSKSYGLNGEPSAKPKLSQSAPPKEYGFAGYSYNRESETYGTDTRLYNPAVGRWNTQDTIGYKSGDSNYYRYVFNNSQKYADPSGKGALGIAVLACLVNTGFTLSGDISTAELQELIGAQHKAIQLEISISKLDERIGDSKSCPSNPSKGYQKLVAKREEYRRQLVEQDRISNRILSKVYTAAATCGL